MDKFEGKDNYGKPKSEFIDKLAGMDDEALQGEAEKYIWLSAYAANNPRSDYHWQCDATHAEAKKRDPEKASIYDRAYKNVERENFG